MGRTASGTKDDVEKMLNEDSSYKGKIENKRSLVTMQDPAMYKATKKAISRFYSATGAIERNIKLADMEFGVLGVGTKGEVYLNSGYFGGKDSAKKLAVMEKKMQQSGFGTKNNKPLSTTIHHELGHAVWSSSQKTPNHIAAGKEIKKLRLEWHKDKNKQGYGSYSKTNIDEFWAELMVHAVSGNQDKYTKKAKEIIKKYKL